MGVINYIRVLFKDYPSTETPVTAANLNKLDKGIYDLDQALGGYQPRLTNPLTRANIVDNLSSTSTTDVLSAKQGKVLYDSFSSALTALKNTAIAQAVGATGSTFTSVIATLGNIVNRGAVSKTLTLSDTRYTVPQGYHNGSGVVNINITGQTKSTTATTSAQTIVPDSGKVLTSVTVNPQQHSGTCPTITTNGTKDLGTIHNYKYLNISINQIPNSVKILDWTQTNSEITSKDITLSGYSSYTVIVVTRYGSGGVSLSNRSGCTVSTVHSGAVVNGDSNSSFIGIYRVTGSGTVRAQGGYVSDVFVIGHSC
jgi:hypothetical protein